MTHPLPAGLRRHGLGDQDPRRLRHRRRGEIRSRFEVPNTGKTFAGLVQRLAKLAVEGVAIERCDGPLVEALLDAGLGRGGHPPAVEGLRSRYCGSGAKSDAGDAYLLADVLRTDGHRLEALTQDGDATRVLRALSRTRKQLVEARVGLPNRLTGPRPGLPRRGGPVRPPRLRHRDRVLAPLRHQQAARG